MATAPGPSAARYTVPEFVLDIAQLLDVLGTFPVTLVGHSLGGAVALHYTGSIPERVKKLVAIEGLGPPPSMLEALREKPRGSAWTMDPPGARFRGALAAALPLDRRRGRAHARGESVPLGRAGAPSDRARRRANEDGTYGWKFDNYVRSLFPERYDMQEARAAWGRIACPTLLIRGQESLGRRSRQRWADHGLPDARLVNVPNAGHWVHHDQLDVFLREVGAFLAA